MSIFGYEFFSLKVVCFVEYEMSVCCSTSSPHSEGQAQQLSHQWTGTENYGEFKHTHKNKNKKLTQQA